MVRVARVRCNLVGFAIMLSRLSATPRRMIWQPRVRVHLRLIQFRALSTTGLALCHGSYARADDARDWGLARCGHHPCSDGRPARHLALDFACFCGAASCTFSHCLRRCPCTAGIRAAWAHSLGIPANDACAMNRALASSWLCDPEHRSNNRRTVSAHMRLVARVCRFASACRLEPRSRQ